MKVAISGCGVAGPTLAYWLERGGCRPILVESAPELRTGGYMVDFWGLGYEVAVRMGLEDALHDVGYQLVEARFVNARGRITGRIPTEMLQRELKGRFTSLPRGDLTAVLHRSLGTRVETRFGTSIAGLDEREDGVAVSFDDGRRETFDLVVGADGLHSRVRRLALGPQAKFEHPVGYTVAAFDAPGYRPRDELAYVSCGIPGRQLSRFSQRGDSTMVLLVLAAEWLEGKPLETDAERRRALIEAFDGAGWEWPAIRAALEQAESLYFDRVSQIVAPSWSKCRVVLVGDAAAAVSLLSGEGCGLSMTEAYVLAQEIVTCRDDHAAAFSRYERRLRAFVDGKQRAARALAYAFTPRTAFGVWLRDLATRLTAVPGVAGLLLGPQLKDELELPPIAF